MQTKCWSTVSTRLWVYGQLNSTDQTVLYMELISECQPAEDNYVTVNYPFESLNVEDGLRKGELVTITAGSGVGKVLCRHVALLLQKILKLDT